jgi:hypothetical protein
MGLKRCLFFRTDFKLPRIFVLLLQNGWFLDLEAIDFLVD